MKRFGTERLIDADAVGCIAVEQGREGPMAAWFAYESVTPPTGPTLWFSCTESRTAQGWCHSPNGVHSLPLMFLLLLLLPSYLFLTRVSFRFKSLSCWVFPPSPCCPGDIWTTANKMRALFFFTALKALHKCFFTSILWPGPDAEVLKYFDKSCPGSSFCFYSYSEGEN